MSPSSITSHLMHHIVEHNAESTGDGTVIFQITGSVLLIIFPMSHNFCITPNETPVSLES